MEITGNTSPYLVGNAASLTCAVTGGNPAPHSYTWSLAGNALGEMSNMLALSPLTITNDGQDILCTAINTVGTVASGTSTLTVHCECFQFPLFLQKLGALSVGKQQISVIDAVKVELNSPKRLCLKPQIKFLIDFTNLSTF